MAEARRTCITPGCGAPTYALGHCKSCYDRVLRWFPTHCRRCVDQLGALAADGGRGDRALVAGTMTMAEASAYMLGFYDRRGQPGDGDAIDPYIVQRFHELRTGAG